MFSCQVSKNCGPAKEEEEALEKRGCFDQLQMFQNIFSQQNLHFDKIS